jgi:hypothetical protein
MYTTPKALAQALGQSNKTIRWFLRMRFPRPERQKYDRWDVSLEMVIAATRHFG